MATNHFGQQNDDVVCDLVFTMKVTVFVQKKFIKMGSFCVFAYNMFLLTAAVWSKANWKGLKHIWGQNYYK